MILKTLHIVCCVTMTVLNIRFCLFFSFTSLFADIVISWSTTFASFHTILCSLALEPEPE